MMYVYYATVFIDKHKARPNSVQHEMHVCMYDNTIKAHKAPGCWKSLWPPMLGIVPPIVGLPISNALSLPPMDEFRPGSYLMIQPNGSCERIKEPSPLCMLPGISQISSISVELMGASCVGFTNCTSRSKSSARSQPEACPFNGLLSIFSQAVRTANLIVAARDGFARLALPIDPKALPLFGRPKPADLSTKQIIKDRTAYQAHWTKVVDLILEDRQTVIAELTRYAHSHAASHEDDCQVLRLHRKLLALRYRTYEPKLTTNRIRISRVDTKPLSYRTGRSGCHTSSLRIGRIRR